MSDRNVIEPVDFSRAMRLLIGTAPDRIDQEAVNAVFAELNQDNRTAQTMLALADIAHTRDPQLRTDDGIAALRTVIARFTALDDEGNTDD